MLDSERNNSETGTNEAAGRNEGTAPAPTVFNGPAEQPAPTAPAVPAALFQPPQAVFQPPVVPPPTADRPSADRDFGGRDSGGRDSGGRDSGERESGDWEPAGQEAGGGRTEAEPGSSRTSRRTRGRGRGTAASRVRDAAADDDLFSADAGAAVAEADTAGSGDADAGAAVTEEADEQAGGRRTRRRRNTRTRTRGGDAAGDDIDGQGASDDAESDGEPGDDDGETGTAGRRRRRKRRRGSVDGDVLSPDDPPDTVVHVREAHNPADDVRAIRGSTRLEAKKQRRREGRESGRRRPPVVTESEFLARRESVERTMIVRQRGDRTQIAVLEDGVLVEHYVNRTTHASYVGNVYLGKVQNVLPSMEAAFVDIGKGRNAVLYAGEVNFDASGLEGQPKRIEAALKPGQSVIVQVTKDPVGHKGARLTSQVSLPGRYLVYVPGASMTGISRKLPDTERTRLKQILKKVTPEHAGVIVRTAAEGAAEAELDRDITRLAAQWENIEKKAKTASAPALLHGEPDLTIRVVRDVFNEDFSRLIVSGEDGWDIIDEYVKYVAPHLADRLSRWDSPDNEDAADDVFAAYRIDEQLAKALDRKVWLPSGGSLVIDRTEAMTVIDVNTGKFTGQGGNLEETVTRNNLEAAEEIVRQLRLRDVGGIVVIDFIDMVLESNRELVLRRLLECLARDRTKHQVAEVTSLGLVQMTRKRVGAGLLEAFSQQCECCNGRGVIVALDTPAEPAHRASAGTAHRPVPAPPAHGPGNGNGKTQGNGAAAGSGAGSGKGGGYANGRRDSDRRDSRRDEGRGGREAQRDTALSGTAVDDTELAGTALAGTSLAGTAMAGTAGTAPAGTASVTGTAPGTGTASGTGTAADGGRRTRRPTSSGTAFAAAVQVEDSPAPTVVVPVTPEPALADQVTASATVPADPAAPVRRTRTRAGSAVARVTVVTDTTPAPAPVEDASADVALAESALVVEDAAPVEGAAPAPFEYAAPMAPEQPETAVAAEVPESFVTPEPTQAPEAETPNSAQTPEAGTPEAGETAGVATDAEATIHPMAPADPAAPTGPAVSSEANADGASQSDAAAQAEPAPEAQLAEAAAPAWAGEAEAAQEAAAAWPAEPAIVSPSLFDATPADSAAEPAASDATPAEYDAAAADHTPADSAEEGDTAAPGDTTTEGPQPWS